MASFWDKLVLFYRQGTVVNRLILINCGIFLFVRLFVAVLGLFHADTKTWLDWLLLSADGSVWFSKPWTAITYMFVHYKFMHLLMNMMWLYVFGQFFSRWFTSPQLLIHYVFGGLAGAFVFLVGNAWLLSSSELVVPSHLLGASAAIMTLCIAVAVYRPDEPISLFLLGTLKLKYLALIMIGLDVLSLNAADLGVGLAHLGGALYGLTVGLTARNGTNLVGWFERLYYRFSIKTTAANRKRSTMRVKYQRSNRETTNRSVNADQVYRDKKKRDENRLDAILDKVKQSGYDSLSEEEKRHLFNFGNSTNR